MADPKAFSTKIYYTGDATFYIENNFGSMVHTYADDPLGLSKTPAFVSLNSN